MRVLSAAGCEPVVVVLGAWVGDVSGAHVVVNDGWASGMGSSLRAGLEELTAYDDVDRVVVSLVDLVGLTPAAVGRVVACEADLAAAAYDGERAHPVLLGRAHWDAVAQTAVGDRGARSYLASHDVVLVEVGDVATGEDLDVAPI